MTSIKNNPAPVVAKSIVDISRHDQDKNGLLSFKELAIFADVKPTDGVDTVQTKIQTALESFGIDKKTSSEASTGKTELPVTDLQTAVDMKLDQLLNFSFETKNILLDKKHLKRLPYIKDLIKKPYYEQFTKEPKNHYPPIFNKDQTMEQIFQQLKATPELFGLDARQVDDIFQQWQGKTGTY